MDQLPEDSSIFNPDYHNIRNVAPRQQQTSFPAPSHEYGLYKQQTGIVPGALEDTLAMNQSNTPLLNYDFPLLNETLADELFDFNTASSQVSATSPDLSLLGLSSISDPNFLLGTTIDPNFIGGQEPDTLTPPPPPPALTSNIGHLRPGMHSQAAMARRAEQQQALTQQQMLAQQQQQLAQQQQQQMLAQQGAQSRSASLAPPTPESDTEQKINRVIGVTHCEPPKVEPITTVPLDLPKLKKDFEEMDDDEKLLASESGKQLPTGSRRRIRNKVSARHFRERRKKYMEALEQELIKQANENALHKAKIQAIEDENKRMTSFIKMLLSSPHFSGMLNDLSNNPEQILHMGPPPMHPAQQQMPNGQQPIRQMMPPPRPQQQQMFSG
ncbi:uncharacterized protein B0T15DRAFT_437254 [Chaetomium strumarium]|uniref:BZIP domain-containing protein n=1 Tax=Chaetomium strumarium TaxID=1170767 RepID=A0AAJ0GRQ9_9PEZI|nr:hypothetical protein B0T15DRAFT_437254 [Chaetomium strumarium]